MSNLITETVTSVKHYTDRLFSFTTTRDPTFRFRSGQFTMIGIQVDGKPLLRAYSIASAHYDEYLEFYSIKVENGPLTSRLKDIEVGHSVLVNRKATGTLVLDNLVDGRNLYFFSTGTGVAPFTSLIKDPEAYSRFDKVVLLHGCREVAELAYGEQLIAQLREDEFLGEMVRNQLVYYPTITREPFRNQGRLTDLVQSGKLYQDIGLPPIRKGEDCAMICGSPEMLKDTKQILLDLGMEEGNAGEPGDFVVEKAFAER
ncbi:ferredoxin--NADP reductase [Zavarzinia sp. CC-PAN008]|uniref:ferredoxin--NADP reductase n=1 Tax=Zavarzinia sp. CC-PAN008 TaxID=3243332 RepID=UPI003F749094